MILPGNNEVLPHLHCSRPPARLSLSLSLSLSLAHAVCLFLSPTRFASSVLPLHTQRPLPSSYTACLA